MKSRGVHFVFRVIILAGIFFLPAAFVFAESAPLVTTIMPTAISEKSATLNGRIIGGEMPDTRAWFEWGLASDPTRFFETPRRTVGGGNLLVTESITGLAPETDYIVRAVAESSRGRDQGVTAYFRTKALPATGIGIVKVLTFDAKDIEKTSATLRGYAAPHASTDARVYFRWGPTVALENETPKTAFRGQSSEYTAPLRGLTPGTIYYYRAMGTTGTLSAQGDLKFFLTPGTSPTTGVGTGGGPAGTSGVTVNGGTKTATPTITHDRNDPNWSGAMLYYQVRGANDIGITLYTEYGKDKSALERKSYTSYVYGDSMALQVLSGLDACTTYYYRGVISYNGVETKTGIDSFTTMGYMVGDSCSRTNPNSTLVAGVGASGNTTPNTGVAGEKNTGTATTTKSSGGGIPSAPSWRFPFFNGASNESASTTNTATTTGVGTKKGFWSRFFGGGDESVESSQNAAGAQKGPLLVSVTTANDNVGPHAPVEYTIGYTYTGEENLKDAVLKVILPKDVVYIGDNTANEFLLEDNQGGPERTYLLPLGTLKKGDTRTITMLGMTTADAKGTPAARARIEYADPKGGGRLVVSSPAEMNGADSKKQGFFARLFSSTESDGDGASGSPEQTSRSGSGAEGSSANEGDANGILPSSLLGWLTFLLFLVILIIGVRTGRAYYTTRKKKILEEEEDARTLPDVTFSTPYARGAATTVHAPLSGDRSVGETTDPISRVTAELFARLPREN